MRSKEELNNGKNTGLIKDESGEKNSADFVLKSKNKIGTQSTPPEKNNSTAIKAKKKAKGLSKLITAFATVVSASMIGVAGVNVIFPATSTIQAKIQEVYATESEVYYFVTMDNYNEEDDVYVVLYNDFTYRSEKLYSEEMEGGFENLQKNMTYTLAIKQGEVVITSKVVKTVFDRQSYDPSYDDNDYTTDPTQGATNTPNTSDDENEKPSGNFGDDPTGSNDNGTPGDATNTNGNG